MGSSLTITSAATKLKLVPYTLGSGLCNGIMLACWAQTELDPPWTNPACSDPDTGVIILLLATNLRLKFLYSKP